MANPTKLPTRSVATLESLIHRHFPELHWQQAKLVTVGWDHEVLILDNALVFRFPNDQYYLDLLKVETRLLRELKPLVQIAIPDYTYVAPDFSLVGYPLIGGDILLKPVFDALSAADRSAMAQQLGRFLSTLHTLIANGHDLSYVPGWDFAEEQAETKEQVAMHLPKVLSKTDYATAQAIMKEVDSLADQPLPSVFIHGDIYSSHLLWDKAAQRLGVIDFSDMSRGDPALDFAELYEYGAGFVQLVYDAYTGPKDETFLERAWTYEKWNAVYMMTDHFVIGKTPFAEARQTFDRIKKPSA